MSDEPFFDWRRDGFSQRTKMEFSMGISDLIKEQINRYVPLPGTKLDALLDECLMKEIDGIEREARAQGAAEERERLAKLASGQAASRGYVASGRTGMDAAFAARWLAGISS
tara:strand:- start:2930 stop:3265 length:336 start_codon:yes stop_codon:yes gene_type:complete